MPTMLFRIIASAVLVSFAAGLESCDSGQGGKSEAAPNRSQEPSDRTGKSSSAGDATSTQVHKAPGTIQVARDGTKFDPAVQTGQIPKGAWMCEMGGTVHYAAMERGDGKCPICGMALQHKAGTHAQHEKHPE